MVFKKIKSIFSRAGNSAEEREKILENEKKKTERSVSGFDNQIVLEEAAWIKQDRYNKTGRKIAIRNWTQSFVKAMETEGRSSYPAEEAVELAKLDNSAIDKALYVACYNKAEALKELNEINKERKSYKEKREAKGRLKEYDEELKKIKKRKKFKERAPITRLKMNRIKDKITKKFSENRSRIYNGLKTYSWIATTLIPRMAVMGTPTAPAMIVGFLPLTSLYYVERARSDRVLKIRAVGGVFLAHQEGGNDTLVVKGTFIGIFRQIWLLLLQILQKYGENASINARLTQMRSLTGELGGSFPTKEIKSFVEEGKDTGIIDQEIYSFEYHKTFTIVTRTDILMDMYLQTLQFENKVENGHHVIKYTCIFQKYIKPSYFFMTKKGEKSLTYKQVSGETGGYMGYKAKEELIDGIWKIWKAAIEAGDIIKINTDPFTAYINPVASSLSDLVRGFQLGMMIG